MSEYPNIAKACQLIALDNGGINRDRSAEQQTLEYERWMEDRGQHGYSDEELAAFDEWLGTCDDEDFEAVVIGEAADREKVIRWAPEGLEEFLDEYFEDVC